ncbi:MAG TPA: protein kinase, partial [Candidatus Polarisedimenticolaceae bacterium]
MFPLPTGSPEPGSTVSHYRILERIAAGGMGVVYKARDLKLDRLVALKLLDPEKAADPARQRRFLQEARAASALNHPGIVTVYEVDVVDDRQLIAMELLHGATLHDRIADWPLAIDEVLDLGQQVADALEAAHGKGLLHRDIKPANILVTDAGQAKILDFGLAKSIALGPNAPTAHDTRASPLTVDGATVGTLGYMSPEQARGEALDTRSDLFSLGAVVYEMTTGRPAFDGETPAVVYDRLLHQEPTPVAELNPAAPPGLAAVIAKALQKSPAHRYASAAELRDDLRELRRGLEPIVAPPLPQPRPTGRGRAWIWIATPAAVAAAALALGWLLAPAPIESIAVLPLENLSGDPANEYFADGMTEALITDLGRVGSLRVIARHSVMRFKGSKEPLPAIARQLKVDALLLGSVTPAGDRVAVTLQLVGTKDERTLWSERFDRSTRDILVVQSEVARSVASEVRATLSPQEEEQIAERRPVDPEAYRSYLEGRYFYWQMTPASIERALALFDRAIRLDPEFAHAHAARVELLDLKTQVDSLPMGTFVEAMRASAARAIELDPALA